MSINFELSQEEIEKIKAQVPYTVKRRRIILDSIVQELNRRNFKSLDDSSKDDLSRVMKIVSDMFPESNSRKVLEYSEIAIRLWNKERSN